MCICTDALLSFDVSPPSPVTIIHLCPPLSLSRLFSFVFHLHTVVISLVLVELANDNSVFWKWLPRFCSTPCSTSSNHPAQTDLFSFLPLFPSAFFFSRLFHQGPFVVFTSAFLPPPPSSHFSCILSLFRALYLPVSHLLSSIPISECPGTRANLFISF